MGYQEHQNLAGHGGCPWPVPSLRCSGLAVRHDDDESGQIMIRRLLESHGLHTPSPLRNYPRMTPLAPDPRPAGRGFAAKPEIQAIILNGGTGVSRRDNTFDAVAASPDQNAARLWRDFPHAFLPKHRLRRTLLSRGHGRHHRHPPPNSRHIVVFSIPRFAQCGGTGDDKADIAGNITSGLGNDAISDDLWNSPETLTQSSNAC